MAMLAFGSSFWHASHTRLGGDMDERSIWMFIYAAYAGATENLVAGSVVKQLSDTPRSVDAFDIIENTIVGLKDKPVNKW
jgi:hypothetical protein